MPIKEKADSSFYLENDYSQECLAHIQDKYLMFKCIRPRSNHMCGWLGNVHLL